MTIVENVTSVTPPGIIAPAMTNATVAGSHDGETMSVGSAIRGRRTAGIATPPATAASARPAEVSTSTAAAGRMLTPSEEHPRGDRTSNPTGSGAMAGAAATTARATVSATNGIHVMRAMSRLPAARAAARRRAAEAAVAGSTTRPGASGRAAIATPAVTRHAGREGNAIRTAEIRAVPGVTATPASPAAVETSRGPMPRGGIEEGVPAPGKVNGVQSGRGMSDHHGMSPPAGDHRGVIAIDGPAAAGKTTVARALAGRVGAIFLDTGLLYRAVTLQAQRAGIAPDDAAALTELTRAIELEVRPASIRDGRPCDILLDGEDVTAFLREQAIDRDVSAVSAHAGVRRGLLPLQRRIADGGKVVMVGRDIATVVVPDAGVKIYLDASLDERARRRHRELVAKGRDTDLASVHADLARRDAYDSGRETAPLSAAADATVVVTDGLEFEAVVDRLEAIVREAWHEMGLR